MEEGEFIISARSYVGVGLINHSAIVVIGGARGGYGVEGVKESSLEIGNIVPNQQ